MQLNIVRVSIIKPPNNLFKHKSNRYYCGKMSLILNNVVVYEDVGYVLSDSSRFYINILAKYLSESYELGSSAKILGKLLKVKYENRIIEELSNINITLILEKSSIYDKLFLSKNDWNTYFREYGLVTSGFEISLDLFEAVYGKNRFKLYTKRNVELNLL